MKCPKCDYNQKHKFGFKCSRCKYQFALDPKVAPKIGDKRFSTLISMASAQNTAFFTYNQLYAAYCKKLRRNLKRNIAISAIIAVGGFATVLTAGSFEGGWIFLTVVASIAGLVAWSMIHQYQNPPERDVLKTVVERWQKKYPIEKMIQEPGLKEPPPNWEHEDIYNYGVERLLIVQRGIYVDMFVKNGWHAEHKALVISENGYPGYLMAVAKSILEEQPDLPVYLLHDSTPVGVAMKERVLRAKKLPIHYKQITDLGLFPEDVKKAKAAKHCYPSKSRFEIPLDLVTYGSLAAMTGGALVEGLAFANMLAQAQATGGHRDWVVETHFG